MSDKELHIICLDVPYPADYGGVYDLFYKLPALHEQGVKIHLHCFDYGRGKQAELNKYCSEVYYYDRLKGFTGFSLKVPYIVSSRGNEYLFQNLLKDDFPIFMEGIHCTYLLSDKRFEGRKKIVRLHNVEYEYYKILFHNTKNWVKKIYYLFESILLKRYEVDITKKNALFLSVSQRDTEYYRDIFQCRNIEYLPLFLPDWKVKGEDGMGTYCLYHGNLGISENEKVCRWLLEYVFNKIDIPFFIAGKNPHKRLKGIIKNTPNTTLVANPSEKEMQEMISQAQINVLPSFSNTGIKLKLLNALYNGGHCVVNKAMVAGTGLENLCHVGNTAVSMNTIISQLFHQPFSVKEKGFRSVTLDMQFNNTANAQKNNKMDLE